MELVRPLYHDPFAPVLFNSPMLEITEEQRQYMWEICQTAASDSRFAQKSYNALLVVLTKGSVRMPVVSSLSPNTAALGSESFTLHVHGENFDAQSQIVWNGGLEPTVFVSATELTTGVNMGTAQVAVDIPVQVQSIEGALSNSVLFTLTPEVPVTMGQENPMTKKVEEAAKEIRDAEQKRRDEEQKRVEAVQKEADKRAEEEEKKRKEDDEKRKMEVEKSVEVEKDVTIHPPTQKK